MKTKQAMQDTYIKVSRNLESPAKARKNYNKFKGFSHIIDFAEHINEKLLGLLTIVFLFIDIICQSLELPELDVHVSHSALGTVEIAARALAAISFGLACILHFWRYKADGFRHLLKALRDKNSDLSQRDYSGNSSRTYHGRYVQKDNCFNDTQTVTELGAKGYVMGNTSKNKRFIRLNKWLQADHRCIVLFEDQYNEAIGFICTLGLDDTAGSKGDAHYLGEREEFEINGTNITIHPTRLILVQGIWLEKEFLNDALDPFLECFFEHVANFMSLEAELIEETRVYVEPISYFNTKFFKALGFVETGKKSKSGNKLFELNFSENAIENDNSYNTRQRIKFYLEKRRKEATGS